MEMIKNLTLLTITTLLLLPGCGKKEEGGTKKVALSDIETEEIQKLASAEKTTEIPVLKEEVEEFFDDDTISEFAFVDDENFTEKDLEKKDDLLDDTLIPLETAKKEEIDIPEDFFEEEKEEDLVFWEEEDEEPVNKADGKLNFKTVYFDINKNEIKKDQKEILYEDIEVAKKAAKEGKKVVINGHCCQLGAPSYNIPLSERRARAIKKEMVKEGVPKDSIKTVGWGQEMPVVWSDTTDRKKQIEELAQNRRAEITIS